MEMPRALFMTDVMQCMRQFQTGVCVDMRPFIPAARQVKLDWDVARLSLEIEPLLTTYLKRRGDAHHSLSLLLECLPRLRYTVAMYAAYSGQIDILDMLHRRHDLKKCGQSLRETAAAGSQVDVLEYLRSVAYPYVFPNQEISAACQTINARVVQYFVTKFPEACQNEDAFQ
ncbi:hypothetical protein AeMF1_004618 [Aphanomyces euteiches]|nr:hypothetical protein AeMF1_004618 [Aphanomyces euteiches]